MDSVYPVPAQRLFPRDLIPDKDTGSHFLTQKLRQEELAGSWGVPSKVFQS